jgi:dTDP-4-amino-4,6-dideoxygalactose transaminase
MIRISQPQIGEAEREAVLAVLDSGQLVNGPVTRQLEAAFASEVAGTRDAVAVSSGTAALHLALLAHGIGPGDEVITPAFSFQATANMVLAVGARPVFVDVAEDGNIDVSTVERAITPRTKALLPVHLYGKLCDIAALERIAKRRGLVLIEDAAQAHGAELGGRRAGSFGTGCFSLYATKNVTAGEGGMVTTNDPELAQCVRSLRSHGEDERYHSARVGYNYRLPEMSAALALAQLSLLRNHTQRRRRNAAVLSDGLQGVVLPREPRPADQHVWHQYTVRVARDRDGLREHLRSRDIETGVYYPRPLPGHAVYRDLGYNASAFPMAERLSREVLSLPVHPGLSDADLQQIVAAVNEWTAARTGRMERTGT